jgi:hypothetical protein
MYAESADYLYVKRLDAPKAWFQENVERILSVYGQEHNIQKEDLLLGTLDLTPKLDISNTCRFSDQSVASAELCLIREPPTSRRPSE